MGVERKGSYRMEINKISSNGEGRQKVPQRACSTSGGQGTRSGQDWAMLEARSSFLVSQLGNRGLKKIELSSVAFPRHGARSEVE